MPVSLSPGTLRESKAPRQRIDRPALRLVDLTGKERHLRSAMNALGVVASHFSRATRRTLPFLVRRRARLAPGAVCIGTGMVDPSELGVRFEVELGSEDGPAWALLSLNSRALAVLLDGALGGALAGMSNDIPGPELSLAQAALVGRIARSLGEDLAAAVQAEAGISLKLVEARSLRSGEPSEIASEDALTIDCTFEGVDDRAACTLIMGAEALESAVREHAAEDDPTCGDPRMAEAIGEVPVQVVAVLGTLTLGLRQVLTLRAGQVLRLSTAIDDTVTVRVAGLDKFLGSPATSRGQLAVQIRGRHEV
jgi:flagellar motor switch/type III secretory pathway protein FliN